MNDNADTKTRNQTLIIVEGVLEKDTVLKLLSMCFPEMNLYLPNVHIYGTKIYDLYHMIEKEYGEDWFEQGMEINIPYLISKKLDIYPYMDRRLFTNNILMFDYERHDILYTDEKIIKMQKHFCNVSEDGILFINYPMIEALVHMDKIPDSTFLSKKISVKLRPGKKYKNLAKHNSVIDKYFYTYKKIIGYLNEYVEKAELDKVVADVLNCDNTMNVDMYIDGCLKEININQLQRNELVHKIKAQLIRLEYLEENVSFWSKLREIIVYVAACNIQKAWNIQQKSIKEENLKECYDELDLVKILEEQIESSRNEENGYIWVLCTCIMFLGEYKFFWNR